MLCIACVRYVPCFKDLKSILDVQTIFALLDIYQSIFFYISHTDMLLHASLTIFFSFFLSDRLSLSSYMPCHVLSASD